MLDRSDLRPYQERCIQHIKDKPNCALWVDMGLGKTVSTLTAITDLRESFDVDKTLVVAPLRVARKTWDDEIAEWSHLEGLRTAHILGTAGQRLRGLKTDADVHLINRENLVWLRNQFVKGRGKKMRLIRKWPWDTVVLDESSSFKSQTAERWKAIRSLRKLYDRCIELTGTPAPNGYKDLWAQINILDRGQRLGFTETAFKQRWMDAPDRWDPSSTWSMKSFAREQIEDAVRDIVISMDAEDYLDLPPIMNNPVRVTLSAAQMRHYRKMERTFALEIADKRITAVNAGVLAGKLLQLANGAIYYDDKGNFEEFHRGKLDACIEILDQSQGPVLLAYNYKSDLARMRGEIAKWCKRNGKTWRVIKNEIDEDDWNADKIDVALLHPQSAGHGLNLHKGSGETIIWFGMVWSLEFYQQLNARLAGGHRRMGKNIIIHHIITEDTIDEEVLARLEYKDVDQRMLTEAMKVYVKGILS